MENYEPGLARARFLFGVGIALFWALPEKKAKIGAHLRGHQFDMHKSLSVIHGVAS